ncbi:MAG: hypothetical protein ABL879_01585 [Devosia sp.]
MSAITDEMIDRHAARGVIVADKFRRGASHLATEADALTAVMAGSRDMSKLDSVTDKALIGFLQMGAICHFHLRLAENTHREPAAECEVLSGHLGGAE